MKDHEIRELVNRLVIRVKEAQNAQCLRDVVAKELVPTLTKLQKDGQTLEALNFLRANELDVVTLVCDNPDYFGSNNIITVYGHWTKYLDKDFTGDTLLEALQHAVKAKQRATV